MRLALECPNLAWTLNPRGGWTSLGAGSQLLLRVYIPILWEELNLSHQDGPSQLEQVMSLGLSGARDSPFGDGFLL